MKNKHRAILAAGFVIAFAASAGTAWGGLKQGDKTKGEVAAADWSETDYTLATALATGRYDIKASYRTVYQDIPDTVYVLQDPSNRKDVVECYSFDNFTTSHKCMRPDGGKH